MDEPHRQVIKFFVVIIFIASGKVLNTAKQVVIKPIIVSKRLTTMNYGVILDIHTTLLKFNLIQLAAILDSLISKGYHVKKL